MDVALTEFDHIFGDELYSEEFQASPFYQAILQGKLSDLIDLCHQEENNDVISMRDKYSGHNWFHVVCSVTSCSEDYANSAFIYCLSNYGVDVNGKDVEHRSPLHLAATKALRHIMIACLRCGAEPSEEVRELIHAFQSPLRDELLIYYDTFSPGLWKAVTMKDFFKVSDLIRYWCRLKLTRDGEALNVCARRMGNSSLLVDLIESNRQTMEFVHAALGGDEKRMELLLSSRNVDSNICDWTITKFYLLSQAVSAEERYLVQTSICRNYMKEDYSDMDNLETYFRPKSLRQIVFGRGYYHIIRLLPERHQRSKHTERMSQLEHQSITNSNSTDNIGKRENTKYNSSHFGPSMNQKSLMCDLM